MISDVTTVATRSSGVGQLVERAIQIDAQHRVGAGDAIPHGMPDAGGEAALGVRRLLLDDRAARAGQQADGQAEDGRASSEHQARALRASRHG